MERAAYQLVKENILLRTHTEHASNIIHRITRVFAKDTHVTRSRRQEASEHGNGCALASTYRYTKRDSFGLQRENPYKQSAFNPSLQRENTRAAWMKEGCTRKSREPL